MTITTTTTVGQIAAEYPLATRVFARHGIDFCCGGGRALEEIAAKRGLDASAVLAEIERELTSPNGSARNWTEAPLGELIDHILSTYHEPLYEELPRLEAMARKVYRVHADKDPERLGAVLETYLALMHELDAHMVKEEQVLFPAIRTGHGPEAGGPIAVMEEEHEAAGAALRRLRELTDDYQPPANACNTWRALWHGLGALETMMHEHIHLENNILFPRAQQA